MFTFLTLDQVIGDDKLSIFKKMGVKAQATDHAILSGAFSCNRANDTLGSGIGWYYTQDGWKDAQFIDHNGVENRVETYKSLAGGRPVIPYNLIADNCTNKKINEYGVLEVDCGTYLNHALPKELQEKFNTLYEKHMLIEMVKGYTRDSRKSGDFYSKMKLDNIPTFEYDKGVYSLETANSCFDDKEFTLSNGETYHNGDKVWVKREPLTFLADEKENIAITKDIIFGGIPFNIRDNFNGENFEKMDIYRYINEFLLKEIKLHDNKSMPITYKNDLMYLRNLLTDLSNTALKLDGLPDEEPYNEFIEEYKSIMQEFADPLAVKSEKTGERVKKI